MKAHTSHLGASWLHRIVEGDSFRLTERITQQAFGDREISFTLIGRNLKWHQGIHRELFQSEFGFGPEVSQVLRYYFPRGAVTSDFQGSIVEASEELRPYAQEIASESDVSLMRINFNSFHYEVETDPTWLVDKIVSSVLYENDDGFLNKMENFLQRYLPHVHRALLERLQKQGNEALA